MSKNRWDKLTRKYAKDPGITSEEVKKFLEMNFVNEYHDQLTGKKEEKRTNPALIMDLRHEIIKKRNDRTPQSSSKKTDKYRMQKELNLENIKNHNNLVDLRMIDNELEKFKIDIRKLNVSSSRKSSTKYKDSCESETPDEDEEEAKLLQALRDTENASFAYRNDSNKIIVETSKQLTKMNHFEINYDEGSHFSGSTATISEDSIERCANLNFIKITAQPKTAYTEREEYQEYFEINEEHSKFNHEEFIDQKVYDPMCYMCCNDEVQYDYKKQLEYDTQSYFSMPNLSDHDVENLMKITKFQSLMAVEGEGSGLNDCDYCPQMNRAETKIKELDKSIEEAEAERLLIIKRMELEEKNYQELVIKSNAQSKNISDPKASAYECERIISDIFTETDEITKQTNINRNLMKKTFKEWLQKTIVSKILKTNAFSNEDRVRKINDFLNKIRFEQNKASQNMKKNKSENGIITKYKKSTSPITSKTLRKDYEHKLKVQQDIIELQKLKIQRQERLITEMKLAKFTEMVKESKNDLKMELISVKRGNAKLRAKARCIEMVANITPDPIEEERRKLLAQGLMMPKFLQKMQERAAERLARHEEARERRARLEHEKEEAKTAAEIAKRLEDEEAKRRRFLEMREKRRQEKLAKQLREQERLQFIENIKIARDHYGKKLMKRIGFRGFELLIKMKRTNYKLAMRHRRRVCMKKFFTLWHSNAKVVWNRKRAQADQLYKIALYRLCIKQWRHIHSIHQSKFLVAIDWYEVKITEKLFKCWVQFTENCKMIESHKIRNAEAHYNCQIKWKLFDAWQRFPALMKIERETEIRRQKWRMKIWDLLPDYKPQDAP
ncbi:hypothetical protein PVAND_010477 [Polypedilum vanderplanki]|uniref:Coiled-coil domain-containing protein n=1 Tax=Polypedilum vanderplanki TaxID=319348 RepID=A0A9J6CFR6_POLVA|nr:hypothetical protein PVAND_010477 [Polypedilum vanderplanki]